MAPVFRWAHGHGGIRRADRLRVAEFDHIARLYGPGHVWHTVLQNPLLGRTYLQIHRVNRPARQRVGAFRERFRRRGLHHHDVKNTITRVDDTQWRTVEPRRAQHAKQTPTTRERMHQLRWARTGFGGGIARRFARSRYAACATTHAGDSE